MRQFIGLRLQGYAGAEQEKAALYTPANEETRKQIQPYLQERRIASYDKTTLLDQPEPVLAITGDEASMLAQQGILQERQRLAMFGFDQDGHAQYCALRSMNSQGPSFKKDVAGSRKSWPFILPGATNTPSVVVVESPIEAMSYRQLCLITNSTRISCDILALGGVSASSALDGYLQRNPQIKEIVLALNRDQDGHHKEAAGERATSRYIEKYGDDYRVSVHIPNKNDWNDVLCSLRSVYPPLENPQKTKATQIPQR